MPSISQYFLKKYRHNPINYADQTLMLDSKEQVHLQPTRRAAPCSGQGGGQYLFQPSLNAMQFLPQP
jgi:hypothetical protein